MTDKQPEALRLANMIEIINAITNGCRPPHAKELTTLKEAADELRRLHEVNAELVEALEYIIKGVPDTWWGVKNARAAIAKATGENNG